MKGSRRGAKSFKAWRHRPTRLAILPAKGMEEGVKAMVEEEEAMIGAALTMSGATRSSGRTAMEEEEEAVVVARRARHG